MKEEAIPEPESEERCDQELQSRRAFLKSLGRWSSVIIGTLTLGGLMAPDDAAGWVNRGGGAWVNGRGGGGGAGWVNRAGAGGAAWVNGGGGWVNRAGGGGAAWVNKAGGGGAAWVNRRGY